jgi:hypothetical protein
MLVLHPNTSIAMEGPLGVLVSMGEGVNAAVSVKLGAFVFVGAKVLVMVATAGVEVFTPVTTGVGV